MTRSTIRVRLLFHKVEGSNQNVKNYGVINKYKVLRAAAQIHIIFLNKYKVLIAVAQICMDNLNKF